jgi:hypothetical protein
MKRPAHPDHRIDELVGIARELGKIAGFEAAETLMLHFGGQRVYMPEKMRPSSVLWKVLGKEVAVTLWKLVIGPGDAGDIGRLIEIPLGSRLLMARRKAAIATFKGSKNEAAAAFKCSRRTIQRYRSDIRDEGPLFETLSKRT